jgi:hypothetical protein
VQRSLREFLNIMLKTSRELSSTKSLEPASICCASARVGMRSWVIFACWNVWYIYYQKKKFVQRQLQVACSTKSVLQEATLHKKKLVVTASIRMLFVHSHMIAVYNSTTAKKIWCAGTSTERERERERERESDCLSRSFPTTCNQFVCERICVFSGSHFLNKLT